MIEKNAFLGTMTEVSISKMQLDPDNPRLPVESQGQSQEDLAVSLALGFQSITVAESIANHGYFASEPLIALPAAENGIHIVVEGNRRLSALRGLADPKFRAAFMDADRWNELASIAQIGPDFLVPVVIAPDRQSVVPIIGFRHISGILQWQPYAQARYIATLIDRDGMTVKQVSDMIGVDRTRVGNLYRDQAIALQAKSIGIDTGQLESSFSLLTVAMNSTSLRDHIGAPSGAKTERGVPPVPQSKSKELKELLAWVFGDGAIKPVIPESRDISKLGTIVASPAGLKALRDGDSFDLALQVVKDDGKDPRKRLLNHLKTGRNSLVLASEYIADFSDDDEVTDFIDEIRSAVDALESVVDEP